MRVTMKDIAEKCGLSSAAVSQVLRNPNHERFPESTREKILAAAEELNYRPNRLSQALRQKRSNLIGFVLPWDNPELMDTVESVASESGYKVMVQFTASPRAGKESEALEALLDWNADGIIWFPYGPAKDYADVLKKIFDNRVPIVFMQRGLKNFPCIQVETDYRGGIKECVEHLRSQGFKKIFYLNQRSNFDLAMRREDYFRQFCNQSDMDLEILYCEERDVINTANILSSKQTSALENEMPNCAICTCDWLAAGLLEQFEKKGINVPEQVGLVVIGDLLVGGWLRVSNLTRPRLTSVRQESGIQAKKAVELLLKEIEKDRWGREEIITIPMTFVPQGSTIRKT